MWGNFHSYFVFFGFSSYFPLSHTSGWLLFLVFRRYETASCVFVCMCVGSYEITLNDLVYYIFVSLDSNFKRMCVQFPVIVQTKWNDIYIHLKKRNKRQEPNLTTHMHCYEFFAIFVLLFLDKYDCTMHMACKKTNKR